MLNKKIIDAREKFPDLNKQFQVSIVIDANLGLLIAVIGAMLHGQKIRINHTFTENPLRASEVSE